MSKKVAMPTRLVSAIVVGFLASLVLTSPALADPYLVDRTRTDGKSVAIIFADGPNPEWTPKILDLLRSNHARATFCIKGIDAAKQPVILQRIALEGHTLCNHTWKHDKPADLTESQIRDDLASTNAAIRTAVGDPDIPIPYFLAPSSAYGPHAPTIAAEFGMTSVLTTVHPLDYDGSTGDVIADRIRTQLKDGGIILTHDGIPNVSQTYAAYSTLLPELRNAGWRFDLPKNVVSPTVECTAPQWNWRKLYTPGERISQHGRLYQSHWYTIVAPPNAARWLWNDLGPC